MHAKQANASTFNYLLICWYAYPVSKPLIRAYSLHMRGRAQKQINGEAASLNWKIEVPNQNLRKSKVELPQNYKFK